MNMLLKEKEVFFCGYREPLVLLYSFHDNRVRMRMLTHPRYKQSKGVTISTHIFVRRPKFPSRERLNSLTFVERKKVKCFEI